ncbi:MAG: dienelactone hydrolase family protein [Alphaproteobacteria bacterium]|nr:MAG: dienelactone hydrolase family protein [Alphaproteobacteria bacterium]
MAERPKPTRQMIELYDEYTHLTLDRRRFMDALTRMAGGTAAAAAMVPLLEANPAAAALVEPDDDRIVAEDITYPGASGEMKGYLVRPAGVTEDRPGVVVIHENRGLNGYIRDVARRLAVDGFIALAPDLLSPMGGTPEDSDEAREMIRELKGPAVRKDLRKTARYLARLKGCSGKVGAVGFCWGGRAALLLAVAYQQLDAAVAFYGRPLGAKAARRIKAPLMLHYAGLDERVNRRIPKFEKALKEAGIEYQIFMYEGVNHAFHNDTSAARYDQAAADLAWQRTVIFLAEKLELLPAEAPATREEPAASEEATDDSDKTPARRKRKTK